MNTIRHQIALGLVLISYKYIKENKNVQDYFLSKNVGYGKLEKVENEYKQQCIKAWKNFKKLHKSYTGSESGWAAAIEYDVKKGIDDSVTQEQIAKKYNANIIIRQKLELKRKGYALMEAIEKITKTKNYDAYFIFDADNILDKNYISEMNKSFMSGYDIGIWIPG